MLLARLMAWESSGRSKWACDHMRLGGSKLWLVAVGGWIRWGKRSGSVADGWSPSWWAVAFVLAGTCLQTLFQPQAKHYCLCYWLPEAGSPCQPNCLGSPQGSFLGIGPAPVDSYLQGLRSAQELEVLRLLQVTQMGVCIFSVFSTKISLER